MRARSLVKARGQVYSRIVFCFLHLYLRPRVRVAVGLRARVIFRVKVSS